MAMRMVQFRRYRFNFSLGKFPDMSRTIIVFCGCKIHLSSPIIDYLYQLALDLPQILYHTLVRVQLFFDYFRDERLHYSAATSSSLWLLNKFFACSLPEFCQPFF